MGCLNTISQSIAFWTLVGAVKCFTNSSRHSYCHSVTKHFYQYRDQDQGQDHKYDRTMVWEQGLGPRIVTKDQDQGPGIRTRTMDGKYGPGPLTGIKDRD